MTPEPPRPAPRHPRPGVAARRRVLGLDPEPGPVDRETLAASLARIPDLTEDGAPESPSGGSVAVLAPSTERADPAQQAPPDEVGAGSATPIAVPPSTEPVSAPVTVARIEASPAPDAPEPRIRKGRIAPPPRPPWWRRLAFATMLIALLVAIPVLGYAGYQVISDSTDGSLNSGALSPSDPGYEAKVDPTPTALAIQYDDTGNPNALTFISLAGPDGGGSVIFVPLDTAVTEPAFGVDNLRTSYRVVSDRPALARERVTSQVGRLLNVGIDEIIDLGEEGWAQLVEPVAPLMIDNPDDVALADGTLIPSGPVALEADQVAPYLAATRDGESDLNRLNRHEVVWSAWLDQVAASGRDDAVPGESSAGISRFATALAGGSVSYATLPVSVSPDDPGLFIPDESAVNELVTDSVASPTAAVPGSRFTTRLLNGVSANAIPSEVVRVVVGRGGAVTILGNGPEFGADETDIVYANPDMEDVAELMATALGATGKVRLDREAPDNIDLTIVLGRDVLGDTKTDGASGGTVPQSIEGN